MKVVITGGTGFIGLALARRLLARGTLAGPSGAHEEIDSVVLFDAVVPAERPGGLGGRVEIVAGDISDRDLVFALIDRDDISVFHLASIVSAGGERDFDLAMAVNLDGGRHVLEACRAREGRPRLVVASTYATFGGSAMPETVTDTTKLAPQTTYGTTKAILELLVNDSTRKGFLDGRSARLPTVIVRPGAPNAAASSWCSGIIREPLNGVECVLPVPLETRVPVSGVRTVAENFIRLHEVESDALGDDRGLNFPNISVTGGDMLESVRRVAGDRPLGPVEVRPDPWTVAIVSTWCRYATTARADALGFARESGIDSIVRAYIEDYLDGK